MIRRGERTPLQEENMTISFMENMYLTHKRNRIYIALEEVEDADYYWSQKEVTAFDELWKQDTPITEIAKEMRRSEVAVFLLSLDRIFRNKVEARQDWKFW